MSAIDILLKAIVKHIADKNADDPIFDNYIEKLDKEIKQLKHEKDEIDKRLNKKYSDEQ